MPHVHAVTMTAAGLFDGMPKGVVLHGSRSGRKRSLEAEFTSTLSYAAGGAEGKAWNCTIASGRIGLHLPPTQWGWHARQASRHYLSAEFAQPTVDYDITNAQVETFCWWFRTIVLPVWPNLPLVLLSHAEVEAMGETGAVDGKTDVFEYGSPRMDDLRQRILQRLR